MAAWGFLVVGIAGGGVLAYLSPRIGIPICLLLLLIGVLVLIRAYTKRNEEKAIPIPLPTNDKRVLLLEMPTVRIQGYPSMRVYGQRLPLQVTTLPTSITLEANTLLTFEFLFEGINPVRFSVPSLETEGQTLVPLQYHSDSQSFVITFEIPYSSPPKDYVMKGVSPLANLDTVEWRQLFKI
jgi:hypothetical protein